MRHLSGLFLSLLLLAGCQEDDSTSDADSNKNDAEAVSVPSPLIDTDRDRLWIVLSEGPGVVMPCKAYYESPSDPRHAGREEQCTVWELDVVDHLKINGFPSIEVAHVRDPALFDWWQQYWKDIRACESKLGPLHPDRKKCDPYSYEIKYGKGRDALGVNRTGASSSSEYRPSKLGESPDN